MFIVKNQKETELTVNVLSASTEPLTKELGAMHFCLWRDAWHCFDEYLQ